MPSGPDLPPFLLPQAVTITFVSGIFLGVYLVSVAFANRWLVLTNDGWCFRKRIHWYTLVTTNTTAVLVVIDVAVDMSSSIAESEFVGEGNKLEEYIQSPWKPIIKCILFYIISLLTDTVLMYRLWHTFGRRMFVMWFPCILWVGNIACIAMQIFLQVKGLHDPNYGPYQWSTVNMNVGPGVVALPFLASTIVLNAYCTGLLIWRIRKTLKQRDSDESSTGVAKQFKFLIHIFMESGVLYLSISIAHFLVYFGHDTFAIHMIGMLNVIVIGMAYNLIIIRVGTKNRSEEDEWDLDNEKISALVFSSRRAEGVSMA